ncbi:metallophosphoesterase [Metasolibacillus sp. FSL H7-0170]|uniref:metallophosphoesterase n=1 Tax=Metasolibacillus TaxID=2703677 RepID=UPI000AD1ED64|nr:metallophosphoesterase [Metasolibacillus fluoroglycofenilyticus]
MKFILIGVGIICVCIWYMWRQAFENNVRHHPLQLQGQTPQSLRIFFISDIHLRLINQQMLKAIGKVEAVIIGGDLCDRRTPFERVRSNIEQLQQLGPIYFVWGNNDHEVGEQRLRQLFAEMDVTILENDAQLLAGQNRIWLSAIQDTSTKKYSFEQAFAKCQTDDITFFISHNPQVFYRVERYFTPQLMMGGHLHGGQIRFWKFGVHPKGSYSVRNGVPTLISNGYGTTLLPLRLGAKPECHVIDVTIEEK